MEYIKPAIISDILDIIDLYQIDITDRDTRRQFQKDVRKAIEEHARLRELVHVSRRYN